METMNKLDMDIKCFLVAWHIPWFNVSYQEVVHPQVHRSFSMYMRKEVEPGI